MDTAVHFSSATNEWATPQDFFDKLMETYCFTLDVCATAENAKCADFYTKEDNGLTKDWMGRCWMNPPYGRDIKYWVKKAYKSAQDNGALVVCLLPSRTDTAWWHDYVLPYGEVTFIRGRLKFGGAKNSAPFPSAIVVFK
jgi:phage N-6-adenine-methyltransferase